MRKPVVSPLPPGRSKLTREQIEADQRRRMIRGLGLAMAEKGFAATTVADITEAARVSRQTFYQRYSSKLECFMDAFQNLSEHLEVKSAALPDSQSSSERLSALMRVYLDTLAGDAVTTRLFLIECYAAGPEAMRQRFLVQDRVADALEVMFGATTESDRFAVNTLVATTASMVTRVLIESNPRRAPAAVRRLHGPLIELAGRLFPEA